MTRTFPHTWGGHGILITTFALTFNATPLAPPPQAGRRLGILYHPLSPCILSCGFSPFLLLFFFFSFGLLTGRFSAATHPRSWGGPPPCTPRAALSLLIFSETKMHVKSVVVNIIPTNNFYNSTNTVCSLCPRYSTFGPDRSKNSSTILGRLISSGFLVSMNTDRGVGHAQ